MIDSWVEYASCKGMDTDLFFPERGKTHIAEKTIKPLCKNCPVQQKCLNYAIDNDMKEGYFGGLSGAQRRSIKRLRRQQKAAKAV